MLQLYKIKKSLKQAAAQGEVFHLWWHPHNFGQHMEDNLNMLEEVLIYYTLLKDKYNIKSSSMRDIENIVRSKSGK